MSHFYYDKGISKAIFEFAVRNCLLLQEAPSGEKLKPFRFTRKFILNILSRAFLKFLACCYNVLKSFSFTHKTPKNTGIVMKPVMFCPGSLITSLDTSLDRALPPQL